MNIKKKLILLKFVYVFCFSFFYFEALADINNDCSKECIEPYGSILGTSQLTTSYSNCGEKCTKSPSIIFLIQSGRQKIILEKYF